MVSICPKYGVDEQQRRQAALLPVSEWERIAEELEGLDDLQASDEAKAGPQETVPFEQAVREIRRARGNDLRD